MAALTASDLQVFMLLMAEMALFMFLIIPMPFSLKRRVFTYVPLLPTLKDRMGRELTAMTLSSFISENPIVAKLQYGLKITFIFILILFIDSVNRVYRVQVELSSVTEGGNNAYVPLLSSSPKPSLWCIFLFCSRNEPTLSAPHAPPYNTAEEAEAAPRKPIIPKSSQR